MFRADGLDNPLSPNSGGPSWDDVEDACERSDSVLKYDDGPDGFVITWAGEGRETSAFQDPQAALIAIRDMDDADA